MKKFSKHFCLILEILCGLVLISACLAGAYLMFSNASFDLEKSSKYTGAVTESGNIGTSSKVVTPYGGYNMQPYVFGFKLEGLDQTLAVPNIMREHCYYWQNIKVGDTISVSFKRSSPEKVNTNVYSIEKNNKLLLEPAAYKNRMLLGGSIALVGAAVMVVMMIRIYRKKIVALRFKLF